MCKDCGCGSTGHAHQQVFNVPGMMCSNCENTVKTAVLGLPGGYVCRRGFEIQRRNYFL